MQNIKTKVVAIAACAAVMALVCVFCFHDNNTAQAGPKDGIYCGFDVPESVNPGDEEKLALEVTGKGVDAEFVIDFGENIACDEGYFFAMPEDDWDNDNEYSLEKIAPGKYLLKAMQFDGTISVEISGAFIEDGINAVSVKGTYFPETGGEECTLDAYAETTVGNGIVKEETESTVDEMTNDTEENATVEGNDAQDVEASEEGTSEDKASEQEQPTTVNTQEKETEVSENAQQEE